MLVHMLLISRAIWVWGSLRGVHKEEPKPLLPLQGPLETQPFQFFYSNFELTLSLLDPEISFDLLLINS